MSTDFIALLRRAPGYASQIAHVQPQPPRAGRFAVPGAPLPAALHDVLAKRGIASLYAHQSQALDAARAGLHVGVVTATASGKTLCYQIPVLESLLVDPNDRALFLFPTKALANDQLRALNILSGPLGLRTATLDGDTPRAERDSLRANAQIILSNPDMLHRTLLPDHRRWAAVLAKLRFVVLDESHTYRGVFGSHVALVLRRLRRLCAHYGAAPQFICCSATSANPQEHLAALVGEPVTVIDEDGAPQGLRSFVLWNPPVLERGNKRLPTAPGQENGRRRSTNAETAALLATLVRAGVKTLAFTRTRRGAELVLRYTRNTLEDSGSELASRVASYRAGYTPEDRRRLELSFMSGELLGLVSTNALELGVDIGGVDAVIIGGFPGTVASAWQQAGRAGRSQTHSLAVMIAQDDPLDQFYMRHPEQFFSRSVEYARVALDNPYILSDQLRCAAAELPLHEADELWFGSTFVSLRDWMLRRGELLPLADGRASPGENGSRPAAGVNIRSADGASVELRETASGRVIEQLGASRAPFEAYPGAVYLHQGDTYLVDTLNERHADVHRGQVDYYTQSREETDIRVLAVQSSRPCGPAILHLGKVEVTRHVTGYRRKRHYTDEVLSEHDLELPAQTIRTIAAWWTVPEILCRQVEEVCGEIGDALHAMEHACIGLLPLFAQCDRADIGGVSIAEHPDTGAATVFVYDGVPGGVGIAQTGYEQAEAWWQRTGTLLKECQCLEGCPACIQSPKCGNGNQHLSKNGAAALTALLLGQPLPTPSRLPSQNATTGARSAFSMFEELWGRLERARAEPIGPQRAALVIALRYRINVERQTLAAADPAALTEIEQAVATIR